MRKAIIGSLTCGVIVMFGVDYLNHKQINTLQSRLDSLEARPPEYKLLDTVTVTQWDKFVDALIWVESRGNDRAVGKDQDGGCVNSLHRTPQEAYAALIDRINGKGTWESNPFVWVYDYELTERPNE